MKHLSVLILTTLCISLYAEEKSGQLIEALIQKTRESDVVFIRNGKEHSPEEAAEHLQKKYRHFLKKGEIRTPEDFIDHAGTKSLISGKAYKMKFPDGREMDSADWLKARLKERRASGDDSG